jgi:hypothetical protein
MYICPLFCTADELFELDAPVASAFTMESVGASVVGVRAPRPPTPEDTSGETDGRESDEGDPDWESAMERGDIMKLKRRTSSNVGAQTRRETTTSIDTREAVMTGESSGAAR